MREFKNESKNTLYNDFVYYYASILMSTEVIIPHIVLVGGESCSGKTTFCEQLYKYFSYDPTILQIISMDSYYLGNGDPNKNYDEPTAIDFPLLNKHVDMLLQGQSIQVPKYCFVTHSRSNETSTVVPTKIIIIEGIFAFNDDSLINKSTTSIIITCEPRLLGMRRAFRDQASRGRTAESIIEQYTKYVIPGTRQYIIPREYKARIPINNSEHNVFQNSELAMLYLKELLKSKMTNKNDYIVTK